MFAVEDIEDVLARLRTHRAELVGELLNVNDKHAAPRFDLQTVTRSPG
jgi:hypothetical protein